MTTVTLHEGDNRQHLRRLIDEGVRVHSVITDPPYGLVSVTKRFGGDKAAPAKFGSDGAFARASAGFMGSKWDGTGIERDPEFWRLIHDILLPGGYVVAFASSRTFHRMAVAIEDAGFITHPMLGWVFGTGMPKAHNAAMAIDKALGVKGSRGGPKTAAHAAWIERGAMRGEEGHEGWQRPWMADEEKVADAASRYIPGSEEAQQWDGWAYGAQALKPALEPIYVGQKPFDVKTGPANFLKHGVGAINIDGCRDVNYGGHPANLLHDGSVNVVELFPSETARFFNSFPFATYGCEERRGGEKNDSPIYYCAKASKADRAGSKHPTVKPIALMQWLCRLFTPAGGTVLDPFAGSGTTGEAAKREGFHAILVEGESSFASDIRTRFAIERPRASFYSGFDSLLGGEDRSNYNDLARLPEQMDIAALLG